MKVFYLLCLIFLLGQNLNAQTNIGQNSYDLTFARDGGQNCSGGDHSCREVQRMASPDSPIYDAQGLLWFDKHGRVMVEFRKNSLSESMKEDIYEDGLFSLPSGWHLSDAILKDKQLKGIAEEIPPGEYIAIEKVRTVFIILGKLN